jgi:hypothetical protein
VEELDDLVQKYMLQLPIENRIKYVIAELAGREYIAKNCFMTRRVVSSSYIAMDRGLCHRATFYEEMKETIGNTLSAMFERGSMVHNGTEIQSLILGRLVLQLMQIVCKISRCIDDDRGLVVFMAPRKRSHPCGYNGDKQLHEMFL